MGNFCARCGRPLQAGEVCNCMAQNTLGGQQVQMQASATPSQMGYQIPPVQPQMGYQMPPLQSQAAGQSASGSQSARGLADQVKGNFLGVLTKPVTVGREVIAVADLKMALIFFVLQGIASGLFAWAVGHSLFTAANSGLSYLGGKINFPYVRVMLVTMIVSVLQSCILSLLLWCGHALMQCGTTYPKMMSAAAIRSAMMVPTILAAILLFEINAGMGFFLFVFGNIWGFLTMATAMDAHIPDKRKDVFPLIVSIVILIFIILCVFIMSKAAVYYVPESVSDVIEVDPEKVLEILLMFV